MRVSNAGGARRRSLSANRSLTDSTVSFLGAGLGRIGASLRIASSSSSTASKRQQKDEELSSLDSAPSMEHPLGAAAHKVGRRQSLADHWFRTVRFRRKSEVFGDGGRPKVAREGLGRSGAQQEEDVEQPETECTRENGELEMFALVPPQALLDEPWRIGSPQSSSSGVGSRSCPATPRPVRRRYLNEGPCQLTSIQTLAHHHRYMFLFDDLLLVCKQKAENSYKLKEKVALDLLWLSSNNCANSFLLGWPTARNYIAHFSTEREKADWFQKLSAAVQRRLRPRTTTIGVFVQIEGRHQFIRCEVRNGQKTEHLIEELCAELHLPVLDPHLGHYQLCFCPGTGHKRGRTPSGLPQTAAGLGEHPPALSEGSPGPGSPAILRRVHSHTSIAPQTAQLHPLHGVENVYAVLMDFVRNQLGISLSDSQLAHLDTCPLVNCRLMLRRTSPHVGGPSPHRSAAFSLAKQFRKVLGRAESSAASSVTPTGGGGGANKKLFGRQLKGSMPPQPLLTMIDHLLLYGATTEGIFRKSPKQQTVRALRQQLDQGQVPDFHQFNMHVTASLLKDYLRSIPGQLLLAGNYPLWAEAVRPQLIDAERVDKCRRLLALLPPAHTVLLRSVLRLLRKVAINEADTKMGVSALAVCIAPSLLEKLEVVESVRVVPELVAFLIERAPQLFDGFLEEGPLLPLLSGQAPRLHQSTDSGLSEDHNGTTTDKAKRNGSVSPDSGKLSSEAPSEDYDRSEPTTARALAAISPSLAVVHYDEADCCWEGDEGGDREERTPIVLSRENSDVKDRTNCGPAGKKFGCQQQLASGGDKEGRTRRKCSTASSSVSICTSSGSAALAHSPLGTVTPRKVSAASVDSTTSQGSGTAALSRRAIPVSKNEALGLAVDSLRQPSTSTTRPSVAVNRQPHQPPQPVKARLQRAHPVSAAAIASNGLRQLWTPQLEKRRVPSQSRPLPASIGSLASSPASSACPSPALSERGVPSIPPHSFGCIRRLSTGRTISSGNANPSLNSQRRASAGQQPVGRGPAASRKYIPPKKTAEELLMDRLEVNWSVPQIRKAFQQNAQAPPAIDTLYAKLPPSAQKQQQIGGGRAVASK